MTTTTTPPSSKLGAARQKIIEQLAQVIVGQTRGDRGAADRAVQPRALPAGRRAGAGQDADDQHAGRTLNLTFSRIQFTPDLMPADITGTEVIEENRSDRARASSGSSKGRCFGNVILADEINRTPPKTQAALLEAMQERQVTVGRVRHKLADPFFVLATQNPIEQEGTYPLPEAQQDRFMFKVFVQYPSFDEEFEVARRTTTTHDRHDRAGADGRRDSRACSGSSAQVPVADHVIRYALALVRQTRVARAGRARLRRASS